MTSNTFTDHGNLTVPFLKPIWTDFGQRYTQHNGVFYY
eukprot:CAMPEP_0197029700 /NCGR_PEP_ID=MMETSP1384-20130603/9096_1 /TAXON_ID=29189 /ORGANISM="Ammonia sp." /LENGTH=37 /DNA_ID= /DNA_START= /DNA_END= /DNA_ORIENTATION=